jgi:hypothetical protein
MLQVCKVDGVVDAERVSGLVDFLAFSGIELEPL